MHFLDPVPVDTHIPAPPARPLFTAEDPASEADRESAFSAAHTWQGKPLQPFSIERHFTFADLRTHAAAPPLHACLQDATAFYRDACRILYLCSTSSRDILLQRKDPEDMETRIATWSEVHAPRHLQADAVRTALSIFDDGYINRAETLPSSVPTTAPGGIPGNAPGPSGGPTTP